MDLSFLITLLQILLRDLSLLSECSDWFILFLPASLFSFLSLNLYSLKRILLFLFAVISRSDRLVAFGIF